MTVLRVNANRMELNNLKAKLEVAKDGHKLLKDKQDALMKQFISLVKKNKELRESVEEELISTLGDFSLASSKGNPRMVEQAVSFPKNKIFVDITIKNTMGVRVPKMKFVKDGKDSDIDKGNIYPYGFVQTSVELDKSIEGVNSVLEKMLELAEIEKATQLMAGEIEKTRRRVNALEYRTIPDYEDTIQYVRMKLDENERSTLVRLMKVKEMKEKEES